jgi:uncharacterized repeat protein (TIGR01451 family)
LVAALVAAPWSLLLAAAPAQAAAGTNLEAITSGPPDRDAIARPGGSANGESPQRPQSTITTAAYNNGPTNAGHPTTLWANASGFCFTDIFYTWHFGDGQTASGGAVEHVYQEKGTYLASVDTVCWWLGIEETGHAETTVTVNEDPITGLTAYNSSPTGFGTPTGFSATIDSGSAVSYDWEFGDGSVGAGPSTSHVYSAIGSYTATVTAKNSLASYTATTVAQVAWFGNSGIPVTGLKDGSVAWGDYNRDGRLDFVATGLDAAGVPRSLLYRNDGSTFTLVDVGFAGVYRSSAAWGDENGDGYLDLFLSGMDASGASVGILYKYNMDTGGFNVVLTPKISEVSYSSVAWGDYDNDGALDLIVTGFTGSSRITRLYHNDGGDSFTEALGTGLQGVADSAVRWGDYDNDGYLDLLLPGYTGTGVIARVYHNDLGDGTFSLAASLPISGGSGIGWASADWGDYDADGRLDIALSGCPVAGCATRVTQVFHNDGGGAFSRVTDLVGVSNGATAWGDYDNDGDLDLLVSGTSASGPVTRVYQHTTGYTFTVAASGLPNLGGSAGAWGDWNNDGKLDALLTGYDGANPVSGVFNGAATTANTRPTAPTGLAYTISVAGTQAAVGLSWSAGSDTRTTVAGLNYNLRVGTSSVGNETAPSMSLADGTRQIPALGNQGPGLTATLQLPLGQTYRWSVQTVDSAFAGSPFASERHFAAYWFAEWFVDHGIANPLAQLHDACLAWGDYDNDGVLDLAVAGVQGVSTRIAKVYHNDGAGGFQEADSLTGVDSCSMAWGDFNNDGRPDLAVLGTNSSSSPLTTLYRNDGSGVFTAVSGLGLANLDLGAVAWGDADNDGRQDLLVSGFDSGNNPKTHLYHNDGDGTFTELTGTGLPNLGNSSAAWGDYNADGWQDLLLSGDASGSGSTKVYRNDGDGTFTGLSSGSQALTRGSVAWGDYDNDGRLDFIATGCTEYKCDFAPQTRLVRNIGSDLFSTIATGMVNVHGGSVTWGDYDSDGLLDVLIVGNTGTAAVTRLYRNAGSAFAEVADNGLPDLDRGAAAWGDWNGDGRLDIALAGASSGGEVSTIFRNNAGASNTRPSTPTGLTASADGTGVTLSWTASADTQTPAGGLSYNVRVGTTPGGQELVAPMAITVAGGLNGVRTVPGTGNAGERVSARLVVTTPGAYYWSVQSVDTSFAGSPFAAEGSFVTPWFDNTGAAGLPAVSDGAVVWGDYDNDGILDLLITGKANQSSPNAYSLVYHNPVTATFTNTGAALTPLIHSRGAWGDYDNDGNLDIALVGDSGSQYVTKIYRGNGAGGFTENTTAELPGVASGSVAWGDYDNDGSLDLLISGWSGSATALTKVYRNNRNGTFTDINAGLVGVGYGAAVWGDYNSDGLLDILVTGSTGGNGKVSRIYRNNGNGTFTDVAAGLTGLSFSAAAWGDYDADGSLDLALAGCTTVDTSNSQEHCTAATTILYHNNADGTFSSVAAGFPGAASGSLAWGDADNDGKPDLLLTGRTSAGHWSGTTWVDTSTALAKVFKFNSGSSFTELGTGVPPMAFSVAAWGDYDNNGRLDFVAAGCDTVNSAGACINSITRLARNLVTQANARPYGPATLVTTIDGASVTLSWNAGSDSQTPAAGLTYNVRVGTSSQGGQVMPAMSLASDGHRQVAQIGNAESGLSTTLRGLTLGATYYWTVQAVDAGFMGSTFATALSFTVPWFSAMTALGLPALADSALAWGDYNGDGRMDVLITGRGSGGWVAQVYRNNGDGTFTDIAAGLPGVANGAVAWGDYDGDGLADVLLSGDTGSAYITRVYRNNGNGTFTNVNAGLPGVAYGSVAWADIDGDGDMDIGLAGWTGSAAIAKVYRNQGNGVFAEVTTAGLTGSWRGSLAWSDYDGDGRQDLVIAGCTDSPCTTPSTRLYHNAGAGVFTPVSTAALPGVANGAAAWGDYNNDGKPDLILTGFTSTVGVSLTTGIASVYKNDGGGIFSPLETAGLAGMGNSAAAWGDYDNDGNLDVLLTGFTNTTRIIKVYHNDGDGTFSELVGPGIVTAVDVGAAAWADYNGDRRLDLLVTGDSGSGYSGVLYRNNAPAADVLPAAPSGLTTVLTSTTVTLGWAQSAAGSTPASGLTYNLRLGTTSGGSQIVPGMARSDGLLLAPRWGDAGALTGAVVSNLPPGATYYWSVQAVDNALNGSSFSAEQVFTVEGTIQGLLAVNDSPTWLNTSTTLTATITAGRNVTYSWDFGDGATATGAVVTHTYPAVGIYAAVVTARNPVSTTSAGSTVLVPNFMDAGVGLPGVSGAALAWGDYDNDGVLELLVTGSRGSSSIAKIYRRNGSGFTEVPGAGLTGVSRGSAAWGDYDNDGDLDLVVTGDTGSGLVARVYRNDGGGAFSPAAALPGVTSGVAAWGDYDNDGTLDLLLAGCTDAACTQRITSVYRNQGSGVFTELTSASLPGIQDGSGAWGDIDNDGRLDILISGYTGITRTTHVYRNAGGGVFQDLGSSGLPATRYGALALSDFDKDGRLDAAICGDTGSGYIARVYRNTGSGAFVQLAGAVLTGVSHCSLAWGDFDNDGNPDLLLTGDTGSGYVAKVYRNTGTSAFTDVTTAGLRGVALSSAVWGDYDNDGTRDIALAGDNAGIPFAALYRTNNGNTAFFTNTVPAAPTNLAAAATGGSVVLSWSPAADAQTPQPGLDYNVRVGSSSGGAEVVAPNSSASGLRSLAQTGNAGQALSETVRGLNPRITYYWGVQSIDSAFAGSTFTTEQTFRATWFSDAGAGLPGVYNGSAAWADYDKDGDLDVLLTGLSEGGYISRLYRNNRNGTFTDMAIGLPGLYNSSVAWGDYDRDGLMDFTITGDTGITTTTRVYHYAAGVFTDLHAALPGVTYGSAAWGDYNNDGYLDLFLVGCTDSGCSTPIARLYRYDGATFTQVTTTTFQGLAYSSVAWGDFDNDGRLDLAMAGRGASGPVTMVYRNAGGGVFTPVTVPGLTGVSDGSVAWGDYDSDGFADLLVMGLAGSTPVTKVFRGNGAGGLVEVPAGLGGLWRGTAAWGDYDNDGRMDIVMAGCANQDCTSRSAKLYHNDGADAFTEVTNSGLPGMERASLAWGDYDNDGDLDILLTGLSNSGVIAAVYANSDRTGSFPANTPPSTPVSLTAVISGTTVQLSWNPSTDTQTPAGGLTYNLRVGTTPGGSQIESPMVISAAGLRQVAQWGNAYLGATAILRDLPYTTYYWSVQAIDGGFGGSPFATESSFRVDEPIAGLTASNNGPTLIGDVTSFTVTKTAGTNVAYLWNFADGTIGTGVSPSHTFASLGRYTVVVTATNLASTAVTATTSVLVDHKYISGLTASSSSPSALGSATTFTASVAAGYGTTFAWSFGDGITGAGPSLTHTFASVGAYTAVVTATNAASSAVTRTAVIVDQTVTGLQAANSGPTNLGAPTAFTATISTGTSVAYSWDFGDGATGTGPTASHTYTTVGIYTATVTARNPVGSRSAVASLPVNRAIGGLSVTSNAPTPMGFATSLTATLSAGSNVSFTWDLGDGSVGAGASLTHLYPDIGVYRAVVTATNASSAASAEITIAVRGVAELAITKSASSDRVLAGTPLTYTVQFTSIGPFTATQVTLTDPLPPGVTFGGIVAGDAAYDPGLRAVRWTGNMGSPQIQPNSLVTAPFAWTEVGATGTAIDWGKDDDENVVQVSLPWPFPFFGTYYKNLYVGTNGNVGFSPDSGGAYNADNRMPSPLAPNNRIAAFYQDLSGPIQAYGACKLMGGKVSTFDDTVNDRFIIQYTNWADYNSCTMAGGSANTFQLVLARSGPFEVRYLSVPSAPPDLPFGSPAGRSAVGLEDATGAVGLAWTGTVANQTAWLFRPVMVHTVVYTGVVSPDLPPAAVLSSTAVITATSLDVNLADNSATASVIVDKAAVSLGQTVTPPAVGGAKPLTFTIQITNTGTLTLHATITDVLPIYATPTGVLTWTASIATPGSVWQRTIVVTPLAGYSGTLANLVTIRSSEGPTATSVVVASVTTYQTYLPLVQRAPTGP